MPVPSPEDRHLLSRFSNGITPALVAQAAASGGAAAWFEEQLSLGDAPDPEAERIVAWWPSLTWSAERHWNAELTSERTVVQQEDDYADWSLVHRIVTNRHVEAAMTDFWLNHLYIAIPERKSFMHRYSYDQTVRANALTTFEQLLKAAILHPAMLTYLDNARSTKRAPNENLGRELLELHTIGRPAGYDEDDVRNSTRALTGYRVETAGTCAPYYSPTDHETGPVKVLGFEDPNSDPDGRDLVDRYLTYLANHPATAALVCHKLAIRFVSDEPSDALVADLARAWTDSRADIKTVLRALITHPEFQASAGMKARTPIEDLINTFRVLQAQFLTPVSEEGAANTVSYLATEMGQKPFGWPRPDGYPDHAERWTSASRMLGCWRIHKNAVNGGVPKEGIRYLPDSAWLPALPALFSDIVDHMSRLLLAKPATEALQHAASIAIGVPSNRMVEADSGVVKKLTLVRHALLDSPDHMTR